MFTDYVLSENNKSDIRLHQTSLIVINSLIIIGNILNYLKYTLKYFIINML